MDLATYQRYINRPGVGPKEQSWAASVLGVERPKPQVHPKLLRIIDAAVASRLFATVGDGLLVAYTETGWTHDVEPILRRQFGCFAQTPKTLSQIKDLITERVHR